MHRRLLQLDDRAFHFQLVHKVGADATDDCIAYLDRYRLHQTGKPAVRGFGARVYFYEREGADPIQGGRQYHCVRL